MKLTQRKVDTARAGKHSDEYGLFLRVSPKCKKSWVQRLTIRGTRTDNGLGSFPAMSLTAARAEAFTRWQIAKQGGDPRYSTGAEPAPTFAVAMERVIAMREPGFKNPKSSYQWRHSLTTYAGPILDMPVSDITPQHVMRILEAIWLEKSETARRVKQRISTVCLWACANGYRTDDPAGTVVAAALPRNGRQQEHYAAVSYERVAEVVKAVHDAPRAMTATKLALEFLILTAARSAEVRNMTWNEVDREAAVWVVPASRMKASKEHRVPLADRALEILAEAAAIAEGGDYVFPGLLPGQPLGENAMRQFLRHCKFTETVHGFRSAFRDYASEQTHTPHAVMEAALAHEVKSSTERAYARSDLFDKRRVLMNQWADYLAA